MPRGRNTCRILKEIRRQIAEANDIEWITSECRYKGDCTGTCPKCEAEVRFLEQQLDARRRAGKAVAIAGISASLALIAGCTSAQERSANSSPVNDSLICELASPHDSINADEVVVEGKIATPPNPDEIYTAVEEPPEYPGGEKAMLQFIADNIRYPFVAGEVNMEGTIIVKFYIDTEGEVRDPQIVEGFNSALEKEALRVVRKMPKFKPGKMNGQNANVWFTLPIRFRDEK